ncbi:MAG: glycosyltransferase [Candidatus Azobacteroides sp.]|nr:glycosyltransferase [Candidatus Azobacteroides sp.]
MTFPTILLFSLFFCLGVQLIYYWIFLAKPYLYQKKIEKGKITFTASQPPVSVIIYTHDDVERLKSYLPAILEQDYPQYEVIVVNDDLTDESDDVLKCLASRYSHLYHTYIPTGSKHLSRKKMGLAVGIKAAKNEALLFTEVDCHPCGANWIRSMAQHFTDKKTIVLGFSILENYPSLYAAYDYFFSNLQMMSLAIAKYPYTGNGRNLAYYKEHFVQQKGFSGFNFLDAGEDDLFINRIARKDNVAVALSPESVIRVDMKDSYLWREWKIKRILTSKFYKKLSVSFWRIEKISRIAFFILLVLTIILNISHWIYVVAAVSCFLIRLATQLLIVNNTGSVLKIPKFYFSLSVFDLIQPFVDGYFYLYTIFSRKKRL